MDNEKIKKCICKKDFYYKGVSFQDGPEPVFNKKLFDKGKIYEYYIEDEVIKTHYFDTSGSVWVYYNKDGEMGEKGIRFKYKGKVQKFGNEFRKYFCDERVLKLKKIKKVSDKQNTLW